MSPAETAAGSLQNLHDIVAPAPVGWWPPAPGWYMVLATLAIATLWLGVRTARRYRRNRYRRAALQRLARIHSECTTGQAATELAVLLKQTALAAWPRAQVASLSGQAWTDFLAGTGANEAIGRLNAVAYRNVEPDGPELERLFTAAEAWIRHHRTI